MQLYAVVRGYHDRVNRWLNDISAQRCKWIGPDGVERTVRIMPRPIQLIEFAFPEDHYKFALSAIQPYGGLKQYEPLAFAVRKILALKPIRTIVPPMNQVDCSGVHCIGIGVRKDKFHPNGWEML